MDVNIYEVLKEYKEELAAVKEESILRKVALLQLEKENIELKRQLAELRETKE